MSSEENHKTYPWVPFLMEVADRLMAFEDKQKQDDLLTKFNEISREIHFPSDKGKQPARWNRGECEFLNPFMIVNDFAAVCGPVEPAEPTDRLVRAARVRRATELAKFLGIAEPEDQFERIRRGSADNYPSELAFVVAVPLFERLDQENNEQLWGLAKSAIAYADKPENSQYQHFTSLFNQVTGFGWKRRKKGDKRPGVDSCGWGITLLLHQIRPEVFPALHDEGSRKYIYNDLKPALELGDALKSSEMHHSCSGEAYLQLGGWLRDSVFNGDLVHSFPELSLRRLDKTILWREDCVSDSAGQSIWLESRTSDDNGGDGWTRGVRLWAPTLKTSNNENWRYWDLLNLVKKDDLVIHLVQRGKDWFFEGYSRAASDGRTNHESEEPPMPGKWRSPKYYMADLAKFQIIAEKSEAELYSVQDAALRSYYAENKTKKKPRKRLLFYCLKKSGRLEHQEGSYLSHVDDKLWKILNSYLNIDWGDCCRSS
ncbi:MAG TPA: hypothetical protein PLB35_04970 [Myxococcota bacterium]|nr:hypothetical protein [Myxococcota bacterium]HOH76586.1 hypothetical protein [Myxococcota bacterium]